MNGNVILPSVCHHDHKQQQKYLKKKKTGNTQIHQEEDLKGLCLTRFYGGLKLYQSKAFCEDSLFNTLKNLTLCLIFDGPIKFLSIPHQIHSNSLFYLNLNSLTLEKDALGGTRNQVVFTLAIWTVSCVTLSVY
jgi:hypothetical protein